MSSSHLACALLFGVVACSGATSSASPEVVTPPAHEPAIAAPSATDAGAPTTQTPSAGPDASPPARPPGPTFTISPSELEIDAPGAPSGRSASYALTFDPVANAPAGAALLAATPEASLSTWSATTATRAIDARVGGRYRLRGKLKTEDATAAFLWLRVDGDNGWTLDNMARPTNRRIVGTSDWQEVALVLDVDDEATGFAFGSGLVGKGKVWVGELTLEEVGNDVATTPSFSGGF